MTTIDQIELQEIIKKDVARMLHEQLTQIKIALGLTSETISLTEMHKRAKRGIVTGAIKRGELKVTKKGTSVYMNRAKFEDWIYKNEF